MAFEVVRAAKFGGAADALAEGLCSIQRSGATTFRIGDLGMIGISPQDDRVTVMLDVENWRVALRRPADGEQETAYRLAIPRGKRGTQRSGRRIVNLAPAIVRLGIEPEQVAGRYELIVKDDAILIINLSSLSDKEKSAIDRSQRADAIKGQQSAAGRPAATHR